jgi:hypothetical protein
VPKGVVTEKPSGRGEDGAGHPGWRAASRRRSTMKHPKPKWWLLYTVLPLGAALLVAADLLAPSAGWRMVAEGAAALVILGLTGLWVRANRLALARLGAPAAAEKPGRAWVASCPPAVPRRRGSPSESESAVNLAA